MSRSAVRYVFVGVAVLLILQYGLVGLVSLSHSEPWPSLILPGFRSAYAADDTIRIERPQIEVEFADGTRTSVSPSRLLSPLPRSHHPSFLNAQCRPSSQSGSPKTERCVDPAGSEWFLRRADQVFPSQSVTAIDVIWTDLHFVPQAQTSRSVPLDTLRLVSSHP
ncbi:MAG: hypothetical protein R6T83_09340 [Salinibacter sp.]